MSLSIGILGLPNVGKSTLFNALLKKQQAFVANYPFATIEPNIGVVPVPDSRLETLQKITANELSATSASLRVSLPPIVPAVVQFVDIAGLVKGAAQGEGLGNKFLSHVRECNAICQVIRYFTDTEITHVNGLTDPESDLEIVNTELILADLQTLENQKEPKKSPTKEDLQRWSAVQKFKTALDGGKLAKNVQLHEEEKEAAKSLQLLTMKPMFVVANVDEEDLKEKYDEETIAVCAKTESELSELSEEEQKDYLKTLGVEESGLERIIKEGYKILNLISFLTCGEKEVRAWTVRRGSTALTASGTIHTDFMKKFIKAQVVSFDDFVRYNGWKGCLEHGKARFEGRDYVMHDGDVVEFKIGA